jgi:hypothetical protein
MSCLFVSTLSPLRFTEPASFLTIKILKLFSPLVSCSNIPPTCCPTIALGALIFCLTYMICHFLPFVITSRRKLDIKKLNMIRINISRMTTLSRQLSGHVMP